MKKENQKIIYKQPWVGIAMLIILLVFGVSYLVYAHGDEVHDEIETAGASHYPVMTVVKVQPAHLDQTGFEVSGVVHAANQTDVFPLKSGNITQLNVDTGDYVEEGQILAHITPEKSDAEINAEITLLQEEIILLEQQKVLAVENNEAKIDLLEEATTDQKELLVNNEDRKQLDQANQVLPLQADLDTKKVELEVAEKQFETDIEAIDLQLQTAQGQLDAQEAIILNSVVDVIDATANFLYQNPYNTSYSVDNLRLEFTTLMATSGDANELGRDFSSFHTKYREGTLTGIDLSTEAFSLAQRARQLSNGAFVPNDDGFSDRLAALDEAMDHYGEVQSSNAELIATIQDLETQKITKGLELEQKQLEISQLVANLEAQITAQNQGIDVNLSVQEQTLDTTLKIDTQALELEAAISQSDIDMQIAERQAQIEGLRVQIGWGTAIYAPFSGSIAARHVSLGESVNTGKPLFSLVNESQKFVRFYITEDQYPFIEEGKVVVFASQFAPSDTFSAPISRISRSLSEDTKQILVEADITDRDDLDRVIVNMSVRAQVPLFETEEPAPHEHEEAVPEDHAHEGDVDLLTIPEAALNLSENSSVVWAVNDELQAEKLSIQTEFLFDGTAYVSSGLDGDEWIIIQSPVQLSDGLEVDTKLSNNEE